MLKERIEKWFSKYKNRLITYQKGFYHIPYFANSPRGMFESFDKMYYVKNDKELQKCSSNTLFLDTVMHYCELEEDLFILHTYLKVKANVHFKHIVDEEIPLKHYCLTIQNNEHSIHSKNPIMDGGIYFDRAWRLFKPGADAGNYYFKGTENNYLSVFFTEEWVNKVSEKHPDISFSKILNFIKSDRCHIFCDYNEDKSLFDLKAMEALIIPFNKLKIKKIEDAAERFTIAFLKDIKNEIEINDEEIADKDRLSLVKAEKMLIDNILNGFPGIELIASKVGMSPTKLKNDFKRAFGKTLYKYYSEKQMNFARETLQSKNIKIKEVAATLGYENAGKFTAVYKKQFEELPSEV